MTEAAWLTTHILGPTGVTDPELATHLRHIPYLHSSNMLLSAQGLFEKKVLLKRAIAPLAAAYVGYIVLNNLNLQINTVGFYQISKIAVAPAGKLYLREAALNMANILSNCFQRTFSHLAGLLSVRT